MIVLSPEADFDLAEIYIYSLSRHGEAQASRYIQFLQDIIAKLDAGELAGTPILGRPRLFQYTALWGSAKHGHRIFLEQNDGVIFVRRILHTAREEYDFIPFS